MATPERPSDVPWEYIAFLFQEDAQGLLVCHLATRPQFDPVRGAHHRVDCHLGLGPKDLVGLSARDRYSALATRLAAVLQGLRGSYGPLEDD